MTVKIDNKKAVKAVKAVLDALGVSYTIIDDSGAAQRPLNKEEQRLYKNMKNSLAQIKLHQQGEIELRDARALLDEL